MCIELNNRALEKKIKKITKQKSFPKNHPHKKPHSKTNSHHKNNSTKKIPPQPTCCFHLYYSSLGSFLHVKTELIKRSALASILFALHSIL